MAGEVPLKKPHRRCVRQAGTKLPRVTPEQLKPLELLRFCLTSGDQAGWYEFVRRFQPLIAGVIIKTVRQWRMACPSLVDDLVQNTYLKLCAHDFKALREFDCRHENALFGFIKVVASNVVQDHFRHTNNQTHGGGKGEQSMEEFVPTLAALDSTPDKLEKEILVWQIVQCLQSLAAEPRFTRDRIIFWLYYQQGLTAKAISKIPSIGLSEKGVESTLLRITRLIRFKLTEKPSTMTARAYCMAT
jgi:RNA polymerase sigma factor (sigma-70 family)